MKLSRTLIALLALYGTAQAAELTLFKQPNFTGQALTLRNETDDLSGAGFQDQASSVVVRSGRWQVCTSPNFQGDCAVLEPGRYSQLEQNLNHRIESARLVPGYAQNERDRRYADRDRRDRSYNGYDNGTDYRDRGYNGYDNGTDARDRAWDNRDNRPDWRDNRPQYDPRSYEYGH
ncbi:MAG TPA: beta/gamma crystallin-related protein [Usitatibacter sp.]|jgi:hypothetical protein|nr:beta/gamma crystallin-related protein [Usitatibacter sp.]